MRNSNDRPDIRIRAHTKRLLDKVIEKTGKKQIALASEILEEGLKKYLSEDELLFIQEETNIDNIEVKSKNGISGWSENYLRFEIICTKKNINNILILIQNLLEIERVLAVLIEVIAIEKTKNFAIQITEQFENMTWGIDKDFTPEQFIETRIKPSLIGRRKILLKVGIDINNNLTKIIDTLRAFKRVDNIR